MGFDISPNSRQSGKRGRGQRCSQPRNTFTDINVTPFVDVMLVLLIVFMVAAPMMTMGVPVVLPKTTAGKINDAKKESVVVSVNEKGEMFIENELVAPPQLKPRLMMVGGMNPNLKVMVRADEKLPYGEVMKLMGFVSQAGFTQVSLIVQGANTPSSKARP